MAKLTLRQGAARSLSKTSSKRLKKIVFSELNSWRITPRLYEWLRTQGENGTLLRTKQSENLVSALLRKRQYGSRSGAFHPSTLYHCERSQVFGFIGVPVRNNVTPELMNLFSDGTWRHARWQIMLLQAGILNEVEVPMSLPTSRFLGSIDGVNNDEGWLFELKGTAQFRDIQLSNRPLPQHVKQVHGYLIGKPDLTEAVILYEDKTTNQWHEIIVPRKPTIIGEIEGILDALNKAVDKKKLPPILAECQRGEGAWRTCPYAYICKQTDYSKAEAAATYRTDEEAIVGLGLARRNKHNHDGGASSGGEGRVGTPVVVRTKSGTIRIRRGIAGA